MGASHNRRAFLGLLLATAAAATIPAPVYAAGSTITFIAEKLPSGQDYLRVHPDTIAKVGEARAAGLQVASNQILQDHQAGLLTRKQANGALTKLWKPAWRDMRKGLWHYVLQAGLIAGFTWALSNAVVDLASNGDTTSMGRAQPCGGLGPANSDIRQVGTGTYRNNNSSLQTSYKRDVIRSSSGSTLPAPSGWTNAYQRNIGSEVVNGVRVYTWEVWFSKTTSCGVEVQFPKTENQSDAIPNKENSRQSDRELDIFRTGEALWNAARKHSDAEDPTVTPDNSSEVEQPPPDYFNKPAPTVGTNNPAPPESVIPTRPPSYTDPLPAVTPAPPAVTLPPEIVSPTPGTGGGGTGGGGDTGGGDTGGGTGTTPAYWGPVPGSPEIPQATPMDWWPKSWSPPAMPAGTCPTYSIDARRWIGDRGIFNFGDEFCPVAEQYRDKIQKVIRFSYYVTSAIIVMDIV